MLELHFMLQTPPVQTSPQAQSRLFSQAEIQKPEDSSQRQAPSQRPGRFTQVIWGLPAVPAGQLHCTPWLTTRHTAHEPHVVAPSQGSVTRTFLATWQTQPNSRGYIILHEHLFLDLNLSETVEQAHGSICQSVDAFSVKRNVTGSIQSL